MKHAILAAVSIAALAVAGCKQEADPAASATATPAAMDGTTMAPTTAPASGGQMFADAVAASDMFEIETGKLAAAKASSDKVKRFAEQMIKAHTESSARLNTAASAASITPVAQMTSMQQQAMSDLGSKTGAAFDTAYAKAQVDAHQMTLDGLKAYAANGDVPSLKAMASEMVPVVTGHLNMAKGL